MDESRSAAATAPRNTSRGNDPLLGRLINERYKILSVIAHGGMGKVYRAEQAPLGRLVALKVLSPSYNGDNDPEFHKRFFLEASIASKLRHPNTVTIFDYGKTDDEIYYIAMELLEGRTLHRALREEGTLPPERAVNIASQICRALREAHGLGVIHRDLKPANVYLVKHGDEAEFTKVLDFGLVKNIEEKGEALTQVGLFMGSPKYMSPEQIRGEQVDSRVDIYALGVMLYEMLTGKVPYDSPNSVNILMAHVHQEIPSLHELNPHVRVSPALEAVVRKCMAKNSEDRYASMNDVLFALKQCLGADIQSTGEFRIPDFGDQRPDLLASATPTMNQLPANTQQNITASHPMVSPFASASKQSGTTWPLLFAGLFALTGIGIFLLLSGVLNQEKTETPPVVVAPTVAAAAPAPVEAPPKPATVLVTLRSTPPGAMVLIGDREFGPTPIEIEWNGADAEQGRQVSFRFRRTGFRAMTITREVRGDRMQVEASLLDPAAPRKGDTSAPSD